MQFERDVVLEFIKCRDDILYFIENYVKIVSLDDGLILFKPFEFQKQIIKTYQDNRFSIVMMPRQMGKSTVTAAFLLHAALFNKNYEIAILANKEAQAREIMSRFQLMYEELPWFLQVGVSTWNKGDIALGNGTKVFTAATSSSSIRGRSLQIVYLDEFAHIENDVEFYESTYPVVTSGTKTKVIITSTPKGMNMFYKIWSDSVAGRNEYVNFKANWWDHPKRDEKWKAQQLANMTERQFSQEFEMEFLGSSDTLISANVLQKLTYETPLRVEFSNNFSIYEERDKTKSYVVTVDVAEGVGGDFSVVHVFDVSSTPYKQVAIYRNNIVPPTMFTEIVYRIGVYYNQAVVVIENNSIGSMVAESLWSDYEYENMLMTKPKDSDSVISTSARSRPGIRTTVKTKRIGCVSLKQMIESYTLVIRDYTTVFELSTFVKSGSSYQAEEGKTDDVIMSMVIFAWFTMQPYFAEMTDTNVKQIVKTNLDIQDEFSALNVIFDDGIETDMEEHQVAAEILHSKREKPSISRGSAFLINKMMEQYNIDE